VSEYLTQVCLQDVQSLRLHHSQYALLGPVSGLTIIPRFVEHTS